MIRDNGPIFQMGYGVTSRDLNSDQNTTEGPNPESGVISKALHQHPVMRFFATAALTMAGMYVGGKMVREGGLKLGYRLQESNKSWTTSSIKEIRKIRSQLDFFEGASRTLVDPSDPAKLFAKKDGKIITDSVIHNRAGFFLTLKEKELRKSASGIPGVTEWTIRDQIQQNLVRSARRLPYELPAAYLVQRGLTDKLLDTPHEFEGNWYNPVDVMTDFVTQSTRNLATMIGPFEVGGAAVSQSWRKMMSLGEDFTNLSPFQAKLAEHKIVLQDVLGRLGHDAAKILSTAEKKSGQSLGAMAAGMDEAHQRHTSLVSYLHQTRKSGGAGLTPVTGKYLKPLVDSSPLAKKYIHPEILDALPGPFRGLYSGMKKARERYEYLGAGYDAADKLMELGPHGFDDFLAQMAKTGEQAKRAKKLKSDLYRGALGERLANSGTSLEDLAIQMDHLGGGGIRNSRFTSSPYFKGQTQNAYNNLLYRGLLKLGLDESSPRLFLQQLSVSAPDTSKKAASLTERTAFGGTQFNVSSSSELFNEIYKKVGTSIGGSDKDIIRDNLEDVIKRADKLFLSRFGRLKRDARIRTQWTFAEDAILPHAASSLLGKIKPDWDEFAGTLDTGHINFLKRKTAEATGLKLTTSHGNVIAEARIDQHLRKLRFLDSDLESTNFAQMQAFLTHRGAINKPWHKGGFNLFGLRPLGVTEAIHRGYFQKNEKEVNQLVNKMTSRDPISVGNYSLDGVYMSQGGKVLDFNQTKRAFSNFLGTVSSKTQIPLIHSSPLEMVGFTAKKDLEERAILQYVPGMSDQSFLGRSFAADDFHLWIKKGGRGSKGKVFSFGVNQEGYNQAVELAGEYRPVSAKAGNIVSRHVRLAHGNLGVAPPVTGPTDINTDSRLYRALGDKRYTQLYGGYQKARKALAFDVNQPDSIFRAIGRFGRRKTDIRNSPVMAALLRDKVVNPGTKHELTLNLQEGRVYSSPNGILGKVRYNETEFADAFSEFIPRLRQSGLPGQLRSALGANAKFRSLFDVEVGKSELKTIVSKDGKFNLLDIEGPAQTLEAARHIARTENQALSSLGAKKASALGRAQSAFLWRHIDESGTHQYWLRGLPGNNDSSVLHTRLDVLSNDIWKYKIIAKGIKSPSEFDSLISDIMAETSSLRSAGKISQAEVTETRTALLSLQANFASFNKYDRSALHLSNTQNVIEGLIGDKTGALTDIINGRSISQSRLSRLTQPLRKQFGYAPYKPVGGEFNPFGSANTVFMPTFATARMRPDNAGKAIKSALGFGTWKDPTAFSGMAIPASHVVERLNRYADIFGAGLDTTQFNGPMDLYLRGLVMRRALPLTATLATGLAVDRTIGGYTQPKDDNGQRVYSPLFLGAAAKGVAEFQALSAGIVPGGQSYSEKREELFEGEVPIRAGRWWPLGNTPFKGGRIQYFRPSWYRRLTAGHLYTDQTFGSPMEKLAFGEDFSPLRPFDPYRFERQHYYDRPYPESGDYFTGAWGPLTPILNATVGRVLKPRIRMHQNELQAGLTGYERVGEGGAYLPSGSLPTIFGPAEGGDGGGSLIPSISGSLAPGGLGTGTGGGYSGPSGIAAAQNASYTRSGQYSRGTASNIIATDLDAANSRYRAVAIGGPSGEYGIPSISGGSVMRPRVIQAKEPMSRNSIGYQAGDLGYRMQELSGIYGFAFGAIRSSLGFGDKDLNPNRPVLASASAAYGATRSFWDLNLGGMGDAPLPLESNYGNIEISEIVRRFIPKERSGVETINPIPNLMELSAPWLPGSDYYMNFKTGDPYTMVQEGEMRLPGLGYERFNKLHSDSNGRYGLVDQLKILGDVAPWSTEYASINGMIDTASLDPASAAIVEETRRQVEAKGQRNEFTPYKYKYSTAIDMVKSPFAFGVGRAAEWIGHRDSFFNTKLLPNRTAVEDWERENVYGSTFPQWEHPVRDFLKPVAYKASQRNVATATLMTAALGSLFGRGSAKGVGSIIGGVVGAGFSLYGSGYEAITGDRFMPKERRRQIALEENVDILTYVKNRKLAAEAREQGDMEMAAQYMQQSQQTMYGADIYNGDLSQIAMAIPKRKREHFRAMLSAPEQERDQILSTAGRLERRIYEAAWGRKVEERPDLNSYFKDHELPDSGWEGWHPNTNMEDVKIKIAQSMGIDLSELGYYPQQLKEANLVNVSYPNFTSPTQGMNVSAQLQQMMRQQGISGSVISMRTPFGGNRVQINGGLLAGV